MNIASCQSGDPSALMLAICLTHEKFPGGHLGTELRQAIQTNLMKGLRRCIDSARTCFSSAERLGDLGNALHWHVVLLRGIGSFQACEKLAEEAAHLKHITPDHLAKIKHSAEGCQCYIHDLEWMTRYRSGCPIGADKLIKPALLSEVESVCKAIEADSSLL